MSCFKIRIVINSRFVSVYLGKVEKTQLEWGCNVTKMTRTEVMYLWVCLPPARFCLSEHTGSKVGVRNALLRPLNPKYFSQQLESGRDAVCMRMDAESLGWWWWWGRFLPSDWMVVCGACRGPAQIGAGRETVVKGAGGHARRLSRSHSSAERT